MGVCLNAGRAWLDLWASAGRLSSARPVKVEKSAVAGEKTGSGCFGVVRANYKLFAAGKVTT
jgi:hypothetical protein